MAYEGFFYWQDWPQYVGGDDESGLAKYMQSGTVLLGSGTGHHEKVLRHYRDLGVEHELWDNAELRRRIPIYDTGAFWPPKRPDDPHFWDHPDGELDGAIYTPGSGYVNDPQLATHNLQRAGEARGGQLSVQGRGRRDPPGRRSRARRHADDGASDRRAGRGQRRGTALVRDQPDGRRRADDERQDPAVAPRGPPRPLAAGLRLRGRRVSHLRRRHGDLLPPGVGQPHPDRLRGSRLRPAHVGRRPGPLRPQRHRGPVGGAGLPARAADPDAADPERAQGHRRPLRRLRRLDPDLRPLRPRRASTWRSEPAAISSRTRRWWAI